MAASPIATVEAEHISKDPLRRKGEGSHGEEHRHGGLCERFFGFASE